MLLPVPVLCRYSTIKVHKELFKECISGIVACTGNLLKIYTLHSSEYHAGLFYFVSDYLDRQMCQNLNFAPAMSQKSGCSTLPKS